jgi:aminoglycoside phosphotransferase family enzyme
MPGRKGAKNVGRNIREFHKGATYQRTKKKFGKRKADEQAIAVGIAQSKKKAKKRARAKRHRANKSEAEQ